MLAPPTAPDPVTWQVENDNCPVCGSSDHSMLGRRGGAAHRSGLGTTTWVVRCRVCHLVYCRPTLKPAGNPYAAYAPEAYFAGHEREGKLKSGRLLVAEAERLLGRKGTVLELGCGRGELLEAAAMEGWTVQGVEMTPGFADEARSRGISIEASSIETSTLLEKNGAFDVIYLAAILEHLYDPVLCLKRIRNALAPGGLVFIDVPNECSVRTRLGNLYMRLRGRDWAVNLSPTFPPFHVVGFCHRSLRHALAEARIEVVDIRTVKWPDALPARPGFWSSVESVGARAVNQLGDLIGDGDGIVCWGRKADCGKAVLQPQQ